MAIRWTPGFLSKLLFGGTWWLEVVPEGLSINDRTYGWSSLTSCAVAHGFFWSHLRLGPVDQDIVLRGMSRHLAHEIAACARALGAMLNIIASAAILSIFFGFVVFYGNLKNNIKNKDYSKEDAFKYARDDAIQVIKGFLALHLFYAVLNILFE